ncbi:MAG TPA: hypothetical protein VGO62_02360, partial [Myxococcota bacterium]
MSARLFALASVSLAMASCYVFEPTSLDGFAEASIRAQCHFAFACCTPAERASVEGGSESRDEGTCVDESLRQGSEVNAVVARAKAVVSANKGTFDQKRADECEKGVLDAENNCDAQAVLAPGRIA